MRKGKQLRKEFFGEELVKEVGSNEWGVVVGQIDDGCSLTRCLTLKPTVKEWADRKTPRRKHYERYDLEDNAQAYEMEVRKRKKKE